MPTIEAAEELRKLLALMDSLESEGSVYKECKGAVFSVCIQDPNLVQVLLDTMQDMREQIGFIV